MEYLAGLVAILLVVQTLAVYSSESDPVTNVQLDEPRIDAIFAETDKDSDNQLNLKELGHWVKIMVDTHQRENLDISKKEFRDVDTNRDRIVTWEEYRRVMKHLNTDKDLDHHVYTEQEQRHKFRQADENGDEVLSQLEYVAFKNPMTTGYVLEKIAAELLSDLDDDKDGTVSRKEFVHHQPSRSDESEDPGVTELRESEFDQTLDANKDGQLELSELKAYIDPQGSNFVENEARHMLSESDDNHDNKLSLKEIKKNHHIFQHHKQNPIVRALHDEF